MEGDMEEEGAPQQPQPTRARHVKKRALKNKALSVSFNEKDLKDFVGGFHKRKKKRRKEAKKKQEEALRRKRLEDRKKRRLEREYALYGGAPPATNTEPCENDEEQEDDGGGEPTTSVTGTTMYDNGDLQVTVTTSEITHEDDNFPTEKTWSSLPISVGVDKKHNLHVSKAKSFKKVVKHKSRSKPQNKRDKKKANNKKRR